MVTASCGQAFGFVVSAGARHFDVTTSSFLLWTTVWLLGGAIALPWVGRLGELWGYRRTILFSGCLASACVLGLAFAPNVFVLYLFAALLSIPWVGCTVMPATTLAARWNRGVRQGLAVGAVAAAAGLGGCMWALIMPSLVEQRGYVGAMLTLAAIILLLTGIAGGILVREPPVEDPLSMSGAAPVVGERRRTRGFVTMLVMGGFLCGLQLVFSALMPAIVQTMEPDAARVSVIFGVFSVSVALCGPLLGWLNDRFGLRLVLILLAAVDVTVLPLIALSNTSFPDVIPALIAMSALVLGAPFVVLPVAVSRAVGPAAYSGTFSLCLAGITAGMAVGAPLWGLIFDVAGAWDVAILLAALVGVIGLALIGAGSRDRASLLPPRERWNLRS